MTDNATVRLRALEPSDVEILYQWENQMELWVVSNTLTPFSKLQIEKYIKNSALDIFQSKQLRLMVEANEQNNGFIPAGMIDLFDFDPYHSRAGVGIMVHAPFRGKGFASEALNLFITYCFGHLGLHQLYCSITMDNHASISLFERSGFELTGIKKDWRKTSKGFKDEAFYQLIKNEKPGA
ncbi:MAG: GNAT family N-acetyltransferase [Breznakibacter sp.]